MIAIRMDATSMPPHPPEASPRFQPENSPEITAPTPRAQRLATPA